jgi:nitrite reductase/ring-hydroxylating ferredoxin subunit
MTSKRSRREMFALCAAGVVGLVGGFGSSEAAASPVLGEACVKKGRTRKVGKRTFVCRERNGQLVWVNKKAVNSTPVSSAKPVPAIQLNDLVIGTPKIVVVTDSTGMKRYVGLSRTAGGVIAFDPKCTHQGYQLEVSGGEWYCDYHGSRFDGGTGSVLTGPARTSLRRYPTEDRAGTVFVTI